MPEGKKRGRPPGTTKLIKESVYRTIIDAVRKGIPLSDAAAKARVDPRTVNYWLKQGSRDTEGLYFLFHRDYLAADAALTEELVDTQKGHAALNWQANWKLMQAHRPQVYGDGRKELAEMKRELDELKKLYAASTPPVPDPPRTETPEGAAEDGGED